ncbi:class I SAM-dependent methyltransferase [Vallicoccus soli]|uniref:Class I SAM-dependent methyltransferase n=1 Tax=Vallicoccus soli TaxID=2339232 RepID=A0A3A3YX34_9ACTN|nr:class I SAM-dependent methyltransferase [Vallicoccus soli]RJK95345.1 hypothetical protein D5H78_11810 [Vallicoccus soli]
MSERPPKGPSGGDLLAAARHAAAGGALVLAAEALGRRVPAGRGAALPLGVVGALAGAGVWAGRRAETRVRRLQREVARARREDAGAAQDRVLAALRGLDARAQRLERVGARLERAAEREGVRGERREDRQAKQAAKRLTDLRRSLREVEERLGDRVRAEAATSFAQTEALLNLLCLVSPRSALPATRGWAASPDLLLTYVSEVLAAPPGTDVLELGSGTSTLWAAYALEVRGGEGRVLALDHDERFLERTRAALERHGLAARAEVRHAPIEDLEVAGGTQPWYAVRALEGVSGLGVVLVDGPIGSMHPRSRYPALPLLRDRLVPGAVVLLDDAGRPEERELVDDWAREHPELSVEHLGHEKGTSLLRVPRT